MFEDAARAVSVIAIHTSYAAAFSNAFEPAAAWNCSLYLYFGFAFYERKTEIQAMIPYRSAEGSIADCITRVSYSSLQQG
jgi:hypothetical protein